MSIVKLDLSDFVQQWSLTAEEVDLVIHNVLDEIGTRFADSWRNKAGQLLKQTKQEYQRAVYVEKPSLDSIVVGLAGWLPNAIEKGLQPFDMKKGFETSSKRKFKENGGWYLTVPFRIGTPGIVAESSIFSTTMPNEVYKVARSELANKKSSLSIEKLPKEFQIKGVRPEVKNTITNQTFPEYEHKNAIFEGMVNTGKTGHSQYMTFRRVSDMSDPNSWIHSGIVAHGLMEATLSEFPVEKIISGVKEDFLQNR
jgi:hypothetical protein